MGFLSLCLIASLDATIQFNSKLKQHSHTEAYVDMGRHRLHRRHRRRRRNTYTYRKNQRHTAITSESKLVRNSFSLAVMATVAAAATAAALNACGRITVAKKFSLPYHDTTE